MDFLFRVAEVVSTFMQERRGFFPINKNKTSSRSSLSLTGTLSSIVATKTYITNPLKWNPSENLIKAAKRATLEYNTEHKNFYSVHLSQQFFICSFVDVIVHNALWLELRGRRQGKKQLSHSKHSLSHCELG